MQKSWSSSASPKDRMSIPVFRPSIKRREMDSVLSCMVSDNIGPGQYSEQLSELLNRVCDTRVSLLLREYERALELCFRCLELPEGSEVILSPLVPGTYLHALKLCGLVPVFVDVDENLAVPDLESIEGKINEKTGAVVLAGVFGYQWDLADWEHPELSLIEDISHSYGSIRDGLPAGCRGDIVLMRLEPHDLITTGGGAVLLARGKKYADTLSSLVKNYDSTIVLSDMNAAFGLSQIREFDKHLGVRNELYQLFLSALRKGKHGFFSDFEQDCTVRSSFPVLVKGNRQEIQNYARKKGVDTTLAFQGCCLEEELGDMIVCPVAESLILNCLLFPLYPSMGKANSDIVARVLSTLP